MRWSRYFIPTLREDPADAEVISHKLLLRAGVIRQLSAGIYSFLPLGQRIALKVMEILREEMNAIGGQEFYLPALHPAELWQESGRWYAIGDEMFRLKDRKGTDMCLGITHEEVFREPREYCVRLSKKHPSFLIRKFFYLFTCEYCFSHYITIGMLIITRYHLLFQDWRGYLIAGFSLVWIANMYMSLFYLLRMDIKKEKTVIEEAEETMAEEKNPDNGTKK